MPGMSDDTDSLPNAPVATAAPRATDTPPPRRSGAIAVLLALLALGLAGAALWRTWTLGQGRDAAEAAARDALGARIDALERGVEQRKRDFDALRTRLADADGVNRSVREELLGLGERSRHLEDAVANLAEQHQSGRDSLAMNEAEFLLLLAQERLSLFGDAQAAAKAYKLADAALAAAEDPVFAGVRQSIDAELALLADAKPLETQATLAALERLRGSLPALAAARRVVEPAATPSRWQAFLSQFVRVSHDDASKAPPRDLDLARQLVAVDIRIAETALLARDADAYREALKRARDGLAAGFDTSAEATANALKEIDRLAAQPLAPALPELGSALKELRNLRATRALSKPAVPASGEADAAATEHGT